MKKLLPVAVFAFLLFSVITNPHGTGQVALSIFSGLGKFAATLVGGAK